MSVAVSHQTRGQGTDAQRYTLNIRCSKRAVDDRIRGTEDIAKGAEPGAWLSSIPAVGAV